MRTTGRIHVGADADVTTFDSNTVLNGTPFAEPAPQVPLTRLE